MGSRCEIDPDKVIMVNIEELSEEDQRKYVELEEYIRVHQEAVSLWCQEGSYRQGDNSLRFRVVGDQVEQRQG
jgi:hypothetical protein